MPCCPVSYAHFSICPQFAHISFILSYVPTLKLNLYSAEEFGGLTTTQNYTTLKRFASRNAMAPGLTTTQNYTTLKLEEICGKDESEINYHSELHYSQTFVSQVSC